MDSRVDNRKGKEPKQAIFPKITDYALPKSSKCVVKYNFERGTPSLKIIVLNNEQPKAKKMMKPRSEVKADEWVVNK